MNLVDKAFRARIGIENEGTLTVAGNTTLSSNVTISKGIIANGIIGNATDVLTSNGTGVYWSSSNTKPDAAYTNAVAVAAADATSKAATAYSNAVSNATSFASNATNLSSGNVASARLSGSYTGITEIGALANSTITKINLESTGNNRIQYDGSNTFSVYAGGVKVLEGNSTVVKIVSNNVILDNTTATIKVGYSVTPYNAGTFTAGGVYTPDPTNGNYQYLTCNGAMTINGPTTDSAIDVLITNGSSAGAITVNASAYTVSSSVGDALTTTNTHKFLFSIRRINSIATYVVKALQ